MCSGCRSGQQDPSARQNTNNNGAYSQGKSAIGENTKYDGSAVGNHKDDLGESTGVGETNQSGIYTKKNPNPGFEG